MAARTNRDVTGPAPYSQPERRCHRQRREILGASPLNDSRLLHAGGLVTSRAAYAFATRGGVDRAENLWRHSVLVSSETGLYGGDTRNALRAMHSARLDVGQWLMSGLDTVVQALPKPAPADRSSQRRVAECIRSGA
jgi:hypothetical protein